MKRLSLALLLAAPLAGFAPRLSAQDAAVEERLRRLEKSVETLQTENFALQNTARALENAVRNLVKDAEQSGSRYVSAEALNKVSQQIAQQLKELDQRRLADHEKLLAKVEQMIKSVPAPLPPPASPNGNETAPKTKASKKGTPPPDTTDSTPAADKGVWHVIESGQTLGAIIKAYNDDLKSKGKTGKITQKAVEAANPKLNINKLYTGQKIFIPIPEK